MKADRDITPIVRLSDPQHSPDDRSSAPVTARPNQAKNRTDYDPILVDAAWNPPLQPTRGRKQA